MHELDAAIRPEERPQPAHDRAHDRPVAVVDAGSMLARDASVSVREPRAAGCAVAVEAQQEHPADRAAADDVGHELPDTVAHSANELRFAIDPAAVVRLSLVHRLLPTAAQSENERGRKE